MSFAPASLVIYTANDTAAAAVYAKGEGKGEVEDESEDESEVEDEDDAISKFILLGYF
jgi:hypothetical protein